MSGLLLRDLAQVATPAGDGGPLRGRALREVAVHERAYLLIDDEGTILDAKLVIRTRAGEKSAMVGMDLFEPFE